MKKLLLASGACLCTILSQGQIINGGFLDINTINARFNADGSMFNEFGTSLAQKFEVPKWSGKHTFYAGGLWLGGFDSGSSLKIAAQTYHQYGTDYWPGP